MQSLLPRAAMLTCFGEATGQRDDAADAESRAVLGQRQRGVRGHREHDAVGHFRQALRLGKQGVPRMSVYLRIDGVEPPAKARREDVRMQPVPRPPDGEVPTMATLAGARSLAGGLRVGCRVSGRLSQMNSSSDPPLHLRP